MATRLEAIAKAAQSYSENGYPGLSICACMGPADIVGMPGKEEPLCRCAMRTVFELDGEYWKVIAIPFEDGVTQDGRNWEAENLGPVGGPYNK